MTHEELRDRLLDLAYGELSPRDAREVEDHAASCEACRDELARTRGTRQVMSSLPVEPAPARGEGVLLAAAREAAARRSERGRLGRWLWRGALVAVPVAAVVAVAIRIAGVTPVERSEPDALLGVSTFTARVEPPPAGPPASPEAARERSPSTAKEEEPRVGGKAAPAPGGEGRGEVAAQRFASVPPPMAAEKKAAAPRAAAPEANLRSAPAPSPAPAPELPAPARPDAFAAAPAAPPPPAAAQAPPSATSDLARSRAMSKAAPAPAAGAAVAESPRQRAIDVAIAHATRLGYDVQAARIEAGERPRGEDPARPSDPVLSGRTFWTVSFAPRDPDVRGGGLVVFVEDGTFRVLQQHFER
jgi:hypothetical protein